MLMATVTCCAMVSVTGSLQISTPGASVVPGCPLKVTVRSLVATIVLLVEGNAICTAPILRVFVANLFVSFTLTCVPPSFEKTLSRKVWLLKDGADCVAPFTVVDRNDAAQLSTHFPAGSMVAAALLLTLGAGREPPFIESFFLQA